MRDIESSQTTIVSAEQEHVYPHVRVADVRGFLSKSLAHADAAPTVRACDYDHKQHSVHGSAARRNADVTEISIKLSIWPS